MARIAQLLVPLPPQDNEQCQRVNKSEASIVSRLVYRASEEQRRDSITTIHRYDILKHLLKMNTYLNDAILYYYTSLLHKRDFLHHKAQEIAKRSWICSTHFLPTMRAKCEWKEGESQSPHSRVANFMKNVPGKCQHYTTCDLPLANCSPQLTIHKRRRHLWTR